MYTEHDSVKEHSKELGNAEARLLATLASRDRAIFTTDDARQASGTSASATDSLISGLLKKKWLIRLNRGVYLIVPLSAGEASEYSENWYIVAKHLIQPAPYYLSHFSALDIHEMTTQPVLTVYISTPTRRIPKEIAGATYRFVTTRANDLWGTEDIWVTPTERVTVSDLERTILDCLDRPDLAGGTIEVARGMWAVRSQLDFPKLADHAKRLGRKSVVKRLGFLLETFGLGDIETLAALRPLVSPSYTLLDPSLPADGRHVRSWSVKANIEPDELLSATTT